MFKTSEARRESGRRYREKHREEAREYNRQYRLTHKEDKRQYDAQYYLEQKGKHRDYMRRHYMKYRMRQREKQIEQKKAILTYYGEGKLACVRCGFDDARALTIDHINNDGANHRKILNNKTGYHFYRWLKKNDYPKGFQTLCCNCQSIKLAENREMRIRAGEGAL